MARAANETAEILKVLYNEEFSNDECEPFRISWGQLRGIAGVERLTDNVIAEINKFMIDSGYVLVAFDNFLLVGMESNYQRARKVPARLVETYLAVCGEELEEDDKEIEDYEI